MTIVGPKSTGGIAMGGMMMLNAFKPNASLRIVRVHRPYERSTWYRLERRGDKFPLAGGPMQHIMQAYRHFNR